MFGSMTFLPLFQQTVQGASATNSGLLLLPMLLAMMAVSLFAGRVTTQHRQVQVFVVVGGGLITAGLALLSLMDTDTTRFTSGVFMAVLGAGMGFLMQTTMLIAQNSVEMKDMGVGSSSTTLFRTIGGSFGVAIFGAIFTHQVQVHDGRADRQAGEKLTERRGPAGPRRPGQAPADVKDAYAHAVATGTHHVFLWGAASASSASPRPGSSRRCRCAAARPRPPRARRPETPRRTGRRWRRPSDRPSDRPAPALSYRSRSGPRRPAGGRSPCTGTRVRGGRSPARPPGQPGPAGHPGHRLSGREVENREAAVLVGAFSGSHRTETAPRSSRR